MGNRGNVQYSIKDYNGLPIKPQEDVDSNDQDINNQYTESPVKALNRTILLCYDEHDSILKAWRKLHLCIYSLIPFPILFILNLVVIRMTRVAAVSSLNINANLKKFKHGQKFVTRLLLFLTLSFFLTTLPSTIAYTFLREKILLIKHGRILLNLLNTLQFSRHAYNWIIYIYSSNFMREEFIKCIACTDSAYEIAQVAIHRPSLAAEILRQLEANQSVIPDYDYCYYVSYYKKQLRNEGLSIDDEPSNSHTDTQNNRRKLNNSLKQSSSSSNAKQMNSIQDFHRKASENEKSKTYPIEEESAFKDCT